MLLKEKTAARIVQVYSASVLCKCTHTLEKNEMTKLGQKLRIISFRWRGQTSDGIQTHLLAPLLYPYKAVKAVHIRHQERTKMGDKTVKYGLS